MNLWGKTINLRTKPNELIAKKKWMIIFLRANTTQITQHVECIFVHFVVGSARDWMDFINLDTQTGTQRKQIKSLNTCIVFKWSDSCRLWFSFVRFQLWFWVEDGFNQNILLILANIFSKMNFYDFPFVSHDWTIKQ